MQRLEQAKTKVHTRYRLTDGTIVPSVTTILGVLNKPALLQWSWECGMSGLDYKAVRDDAADVGTLAHYLVMCHLTGQEPDMSEYAPAAVTRAENCVLSFYSWLDKAEVKPVLVETPLVSELHRFGGTVDCLCQRNGDLLLLDFKTGKAIYPEMLSQLAAYRQLLIENGHEITRATILRIGKEENTDFEERTVLDFTPHWELFLHCRAIYDLQAQIRKG